MCKPFVKLDFWASGVQHRPRECPFFRVIWKKTRKKSGRGPLTLGFAGGKVNSELEQLFYMSGGRRDAYGDPRQIAERQKGGGWIRFSAEKPGGCGAPPAPRQGPPSHPPSNKKCGNPDGGAHCEAPRKRPSAFVGKGGARERADGVFLPRAKKDVEAKRTLLRRGGGGWIRTTEGEASRFTVCPLWPLGYSSVFSFGKGGAGGRIRTPDLLITNQLLYQLSYTSTQHPCSQRSLL